MQFRSWARGEGELYSRKAARWRDARSGGLNRKRQRTGNDFTISIALLPLCSLFPNTMPFSSQFSLSLELTKLIPLEAVGGAVAKMGYEAREGPSKLWIRYCCRGGSCGYFWKISDEQRH